MVPRSFLNGIARDKLIEKEINYAYMHGAIFADYTTGKALTLDQARKHVKRLERSVPHDKELLVVISPFVLREAKSPTLDRFKSLDARRHEYMERA
jgi:hypothetical protein